MKFNVIMGLKEWYWNWVYRHVDSDICCCGGYVSTGGYGCPAPCRSAKEYAIYQELYKNKNR